MKMNDKILAGLLVSLGLFSAGVASRYVANLTAAEKESLMTSLQKTDGSAVSVADGNGTVLAAKIARTA